MYAMMFLSMALLGADHADPPVQTIVFAYASPTVCMATVKNGSAFGNLEGGKSAATLETLMKNLGRGAKVEEIDQVHDTDIIRVEFQDDEQFPYRRIEVGSWTGEVYYLMVWKDPGSDLSKKEMISLVNWLNTSFDTGLNPETVSAELKVEKSGCHLMTVEPKRK